MMTTNDLKKIELELHDSGLNEYVRREIRKSKICIIDNEIDDLKSFHDGLKKEGFSNLTKHKKSPSINSILDERFDLILLDLNDIAQELTADDGLGVLKHLKQREPALPILVITGRSISPEVRDTINLADLVRKKPILAADLANDVDSILKYHHDKFWAGIFLLKSLNSLDIELKKDLSFFQRLRLHFIRKSIESKLVRKSDDIVTKIEKAVKIIRVSKSATSAVSLLSENILSNG